MNFVELMESIFESEDGEGNKNWKRDLVIALSLVSFIVFAFVATYMKIS